MNTLFDRVGGETAISVAVDGLYDKIMSDIELAPFFENIVLNSQIEKMKIFLKMALGEGHHSLKEKLEIAHRPLIKKVCLIVTMI